MTAASTFDTLTAARELKAAGIEATQAEAIAAQLRAAAVADHDDPVTKGDLDAGLAAVRGALDTGLASVRSEVNALRVELRIVGALVLAMAAKQFGIFHAVASVLS